MKTEQRQWLSLTGVSVKSTIAEEITVRLAKEIAEGNQIKVCIGTDSQVKGLETEFATVIVLIRKGKGGLLVS